MAEPLGIRIRKRRQQLGLTLDELALRAQISKPYLSLIENGRVVNPPSDEKLQRLEQILGFDSGDLMTQAHLARTPDDVRQMLSRLIDLDTAYRSGALQSVVESAAGNVEPVAIDLVPVINKVAAGYPTDFTDLSYPPRNADEYVPAPTAQDVDAFGARVHGDSMLPKYKEGDIVIFSPLADVKSGDDCFVRFDDGATTFKQAFFETQEDDAEVIRLQPRNTSYLPRVVPREQIEGLYKATYRYEKLGE